MTKCKCIIDYDGSEKKMRFIKNNFYKFDYIPSAGDKPPYFRVYDGEGRFEEFRFADFRKHFKRY